MKKLKFWSNKPRCKECGCSPCMCAMPGFVTYKGYTEAQALLSVGKGWAKLINDLFANLPAGTKVVQVKEKFGGLRFYVDHAEEDYHKQIEIAETKSYHICEECGTEENVTCEGGWLITLCPACRANRNKPNNGSLSMLDLILGNENHQDTTEED